MEASCERKCVGRGYGVHRLKPLDYLHARQWLLKTGDIALCRASSLGGKLIGNATNAAYTHATLIGWAAPTALMIAETRQHVGARLISLSGEVARWPGYYDLFRPRSESYDAQLAWAFMCHAAGTAYGWRHIARVFGRRHWPSIIPPIPNSPLPTWKRDCSALVHAALHEGDLPRIKKYDCDVVPGDLADVVLFEYLGTLFPHSLAAGGYT
jgi:hypothetical protein